MNFLFRRCFCLFALVSVATHGFASPADSKLLSLVPAGAQIVAGIEDPHNPSSHGRLLLVTHNNNLDFDDCLALTGVDARREVDEFIEVAASSPEGELNDHLLLVAGRFDREHIFRAAEHNGAAEGEYDRTKVLLVKPFAREQQEMLDTRWMAILDGRIAIFGTPRLVRNALDRYAAHELPDALLVTWMAQLRPDVNSWNVLAMSSSVLARHVAPGQLNAPWTHILDGADELTLGIHYGSTARLDFAIRTASNQQASSIAAMLSEPRILQISSPEKFRLRLENLSIDRNRVQGSISVPGKQFDACLEAVYRIRSSTSGSR